MKRNKISLLIFCALISVASCKYMPSDISCSAETRRFNVYMYASMNDNYLFIKQRTSVAFGYILRSEGNEYAALQRIYERGRGYDWGVEAQICGIISEKYSDWPGGDGRATMTIYRIKILQPHDMTELIQNYNRQIGMPPPPKVPRRPFDWEM